MPRSYVERAGATFTTLVDRENVLSDLYSFRAIPNGFLIDEQGTVQYSRLSGFDVRRQETAEVLERWVSGESPVPGGDETKGSLGDGHAEANAIFREGLEHYRAGRTSEALARWRQGLELDPGNFLIRKQIWAVENPDKFYNGAVDYDWQREQTARGL